MAALAEDVKQQTLNLTKIVRPGREDLFVLMPVVRDCITPSKIKPLPLQKSPVWTDPKCYSDADLERIREKIISSFEQRLPAYVINIIINAYMYGDIQYNGYASGIAGLDETIFFEHENYNYQFDHRGMKDVCEHVKKCLYQVERSREERLRLQGSQALQLKPPKTAAEIEADRLEAEKERKAAFSEVKENPLLLAAYQHQCGKKQIGLQEYWNNLCIVQPPCLSAKDMVDQVRRGNFDFSL